MSGFKNSPFSKRLRASHREGDTDEGDSPTKGRSNILFPGPSSGAASSSSSRSTPSLTVDSTTTDSSNTLPESPTEQSHKFSFGSSRMPRIQKDYGDRFVPSKDIGDLRTSYHLMEESGGPSTPSKNRIIPSESDALKEQANSIFNSILHTEVTPPSPVRRPVSPTRPTTTTSTLPSTPTKRRLFQYSSPSRSSTSNASHNGDPNTTTPTRRLDTPTSEAYSLSPVRAHSHALLSSPRPRPRNVCKTPYRVLDAPELADDFYLNLVDWSSTNVLGVGLGSCVYLWTASNASVSKLCDLASASGSTSGSGAATQSDTISSVSWVQKGTTLAVGTVQGNLHIYDAPTLSLLRTYTHAHSQRIGALAWNKHVVSSGSRDRFVYHRDVRERNQRPFRRGCGHRQEVCGLKWSNPGTGEVDGALLASGGNDNKVCIWDLRGSTRSNTTDPTTDESSSSTTGDAPPLFKFHEHTAAVKALAWDPHVNGVLATGGGTQDKHIRFWNTATGSMLNELDTGSQVCNLLWSLTSHELVSTHGFSSTTAQNQICIWKYPTLNMVASLTGHTNRVLYLAMSPDGETIVTGAGDETLRFWHAFPKMDSSRGRGRGREGVLDYAGRIR